MISKNGRQRARAGRHEKDENNTKELLGDKSNLKEIGTIKRFYSVYDVYYGLLHFIQPSVITKCGFIPEKRS